MWHSIIGFAAHMIHPFGFYPIKFCTYGKSKKLVYDFWVIFFKQFSSFPYVRMPFEQNEGVGYAVTLANQIFCVLIIGGIICLINTLFFGICRYVETFIEDLTDILKRIDELWHQNIINEHSIKSSTFLLFREFLVFNENIFRY